MSPAATPYNSSTLSNGSTYSSNSTCSTGSSNIHFCCTGPIAHTHSSTFLALSSSSYGYSTTLQLVTESISRYTTSQWARRMGLLQDQSCMRHVGGQWRHAISSPSLSLHFGHACRRVCCPTSKYPERSATKLAATASWTPFTALREKAVYGRRTSFAISTQRCHRCTLDTHYSLG